MMKKLIEHEEDSVPGNSWLSKLAIDWEKSANKFNEIELLSNKFENFIIN